MGVKKFYRPILGYDGEMVDGGGGGAVESVNGQTGAVTLTASDVSALPDTYTPPAATWASVTGKPATFPPTIGTTAATALAGDTVIPPAATWATLSGKPAVIAAGADAATARTAIGAGTSNLAIGTTAATAKAGNWVPPAGVAVADAVDETDIVAQFNALLASLRTAGFISD